MVKKRRMETINKMRLRKRILNSFINEFVKSNKDNEEKHINEFFSNCRKKDYIKKALYCLYFTKRAIKDKKLTIHAYVGFALKTRKSHFIPTSISEDNFYGTTPPFLILTKYELERDSDYKQCYIITPFKIDCAYYWQYEDEDGIETNLYIKG